MKLTLAHPRTLLGGLNPFGWLDELDDSLWASAAIGIPGRWRETAEAFEFQFDLPGVDRKDVTLLAEDGLLKVSARRHYWEKAGEEDAGVVQRTAANLPETADTGRIEAKLDGGVLRIRLPKRAEARPRTIDIS